MIMSYLLKPQQTKSVIFTTLCAPRGLDTSTTTTTTTNGTPIAVTNGLPESQVYLSFRYFESALHFYTTEDTEH
ncbi:unnamed protein product [Medioppia subpectinata]|uniref:Uncharacterized protein n=1 Tax=Medioppia subpectinata TaxID=1979941 RepID=A0A7R9KKQ0_9ACAR|nr:unnamed protein product [Medioppia subpectinata]CAG2104037.1 unnamed protein product [Medioppia subpectinata]